MFAWYISGSDKFIHDRDVAWLLKSDGKWKLSLFTTIFRKSNNIAELDKILHVQGRF